MKNRYKFETNEKGERIVIDTVTGEVKLVNDAVGDQSKGDATAMAAAMAGRREKRDKRIDNIEEIEEIE